ncbi:hypothetical protein RHGRI_007307 [Rhododendron griersonianum]|uniref:Diphosphomevalonate decarboxylase n=1 Tax=Rhododendron griersonianum TaxID=479676 RepID=A0AAV6KY34_9ERIC|nr:hypothetical protein RHGRI_007307 [Rhododendron griersonianum]
MADQSKRWILMTTAQTPTNIAVIKYWGKRDENLILPINDSISVTLDPEHLCTTTTVAVSPSFDRDRMWLNKKEISLSSDRYQRCLREIRSRANDFEDEKKGIKITKKDWENLHVHIDSYNNFPTAAGLASSAAGFACFVFSLARLMNVKEDLGKLSAIARQGSGSACRSLYGGFVKWNMGKNDDGSDSVAVQLADEKHWDDLVIIIAVVSSRQKETSSTTGMRETVETSKLIQHRAKVFLCPLTCLIHLNISPYRINRVTNKDNRRLVSELHLIFLILILARVQSFRIIGCVEKWNSAEGSPQAAYTFDAGPNAVLIARNRKVAALLLQRLLFHFPPHPDTDLDSYVIGDKSILKDAGVKDINDVEALPPPPEIKGNIPAQKYTGDVSYFICTRPGRGPVLLGDESLALLSPETGLPK